MPLKKWPILLTLSFMFIVACGERIEVRFPMINTIERGIEVTGFENKFIHIESVGFGGAGAGGLGAPQIFAESAEQFTLLVPPEEPIYTYWKIDSWAVTKHYMAFIENRAGVMLWSDVYEAAWECTFEYINFEDRELVYSETDDDARNCFVDDSRKKVLDVWDACDKPSFRNYSRNFEECADWPGVHRAR